MCLSVRVLGILLFNLIEQNHVVVLNSVVLALVVKEVSFEFALFKADFGMGGADGSDVLLLFSVYQLNRHQPLPVFLVIFLYFKDLHQSRLHFSSHDNLLIILLSKIFLDQLLAM